jgi:DNA repair protein RadC
MLYASEREIMANDQLHKDHRNRMRRKYLNKGMDAFVPHEVLEMLLYQIVPYKDTNALAHQLIKKYGSLANTVNAPASELMQFDGLGEASVIQLKMLPDFFRVYQKDMLAEKPKLSTTKEVTEFLVPVLRDSTVEEVHVVATDGKSCYINMKMLGAGSVAKVNVSVNEVVQFALNNRAAGIIIAHSHPQGVCEPSPSDIAFTKTVHDTLMALDIVMTEHLIVANDSHYSFFKNGHIARMRDEYANKNK